MLFKMPLKTFLKSCLRFTLLALNMVAVSAATADELPTGISVTVQPMQAEYRASDALNIKINYRNNTTEPITFLKWVSALEGLVSHDFLSITINQQPVPYIGRHVKRLPPTESDYITLAPSEVVPSEVVDVVVDLDGAYAITQKGDYEIIYRSGDLISTKVLAQRAPVAVLTLTADKPVLLLKQQPIIDASCNATQRSQINRALGIAERIAVNQRPNARRYTEWFGAYTPGRYASVLRGMNNIADALVNRRIGFDCTCDDPRRENLFAFVFTNDPFNMNVCPVFFRVSAAGTDSQSGTIVHEISHFNIVAATDDFSGALDQRGSRVLARNNPADAIRNANAFEYFAENTPALPMPSVDLLASSISVEESVITADQNVSWSGVIRNLGNAASTSTTISLRLSDDPVISPQNTQISSLTAVPINGGTNLAIASSFRAPAESGDFWVGFCISPVSGELSTRNNCSPAAKISVEEASNIIIAPLILLLSDE